MIKYKKMISWILLIGWMSFIFFMSHQPGEVSSSQSDLVLKIFRFIGIELNDYFGEIATFIVRKAAHFSEYFILFLLSYNVFRCYEKNKKYSVYLILFVAIYAITDEFHQSFIPGRGPALRDVLIDTSGGLFGYIVIRFFNNFKILKLKKEA